MSAQGKRDEAVEPDLRSYDFIIVATSGGKDSLASLLEVIDRKGDRSCLENWHHLVDGRESTLFDWPVTESYIRAVSGALGIPLYLSWREGGLEREMLRDGAPTAAVRFETPDFTIRTCGGTSKRLGTRRKFPQVSADLSVRWCSPVSKIGVASVAINNQARFHGARTLFVTGERAEESPARSRYPVFGPHRDDARAGRLARHIDHWRPIHAWGEERVWGKIRDHGVVCHPVYDLGIGRTSCANCVFADPQQVRILRDLAPGLYGPARAYEAEFGTTIHRGMDLDARAARGKLPDAATPEAMARCLSKRFDEAVFTADWRMPAGAFRRSGGPT